MTTVSTAKELSAALKAATGGDVIVLQAGNYADLSLQGLHFDSAVTLTSADPSNRAVLDNLILRNVDGLVLKDLTVVDSGETGLKIYDSRNVTLDSLDVHGTGAAPSGTGMLVRSSDGVSVVNSDFHDLANGLSHLNSNHITFSGNTFKDIRIDGIHGGGSSNVLIAGNTFTDFYRQAGDHPDAIQFWTTNTTASAHDIVITDNLIVRGEGTQMQGIFVTDQSSGKLPYVNLTISGNTVIGGMYQGINVASSTGLTLTGNTVVGYEDMKSWIKISNTTNGTVSGNVTSQLSLSQNADVVILDNVIVPLTTAASETFTAQWFGAHALGNEALVPPADQFSGFDFSWSVSSNAIDLGSAVPIEFHLPSEFESTYGWIV